ncbi:hypothetical protein MKJ39_002559 [Enterococcus faecium]|nr:hypothetical protein [Enterococcus faecium]
MSWRPYSIVVCLASLFALTVTETSVAADVRKETDSNIIISDASDVGDSSQDNLILEEVPMEYAFRSLLENRNYELEAQLSNQFVKVVNDRGSRNWVVKASVSDSLVLERNKEIKFPVTSFNIDGIDLKEIGNSGIIFQSSSNGKENTGLLSKPIKNVSMRFVDEKNILNDDDTVKGSIQYFLYDTLLVK